MSMRYSTKRKNSNKIYTIAVGISRLVGKLDRFKKLRCLRNYRLSMYNCARAREFSRDFETKLNWRLEMRRFEESAMLRYKNVYFDDHFDHFNSKS